MGSALTEAMSASTELGLGVHGPHVVVALLPTAYLLTVGLRTVRQAHLDAKSVMDPRLRRWLAAAVATAVITALIDVLIVVASLGLDALTTLVAGIGATTSVWWAITVSRDPTPSHVQAGVAGAVAVTGLWAGTVVVGPVRLGTEVGNMLVWAPLISGTILAFATAVVARRMLTTRQPRDEALVGFTQGSSRRR